MAIPTDLTLDDVRAIVRKAREHADGAQELLDVPEESGVEGEVEIVAPAARDE
jgi:hypothetical protein